MEGEDGTGSQALARNICHDLTVMSEDIWTTVCAL